MTARPILIAQTSGELARIDVLRCAFVDLVRSDPRIVRQLEQWDRQAGISRAVAAVRRASTTAAREIAHRRLVVAQGAARLEPTPRHFLRDTLGLSSGWLASELTRTWIQRHMSRAYDGLFIVGMISVISSQPLAPRLTLTVPPFRTRRRESVADARQRFEAWVADVQRRTQSADTQLTQAANTAKRGRRPKREMAYLEQWAAWVYRLDVQRTTTVAQLAREFGVTRQAIQYGRREAARLLSLHIRKN
jgi:hypothetical protein